LKKKTPKLTTSPWARPSESSQSEELKFPDKRNIWEAKAVEKPFKFGTNVAPTLGAGQKPGNIAA
jgi:hypothetical protein